MLDTKDLETTVNYPQLYQLSDAGNIKTWIISVKRISETESQIIKQFGILGGKMQSVSDPITEGKNAGKANETTPHQQAVAEAESAHSKKKKKGYVDTLLGAENGELDEVITGGVEPMLAHVYAKRGDKITFPAYAQPKLDGMRCIAIKKGNSVTLWTRTRKPIVSCPHIEEAIAIQFAGQDITLDGELYNHDMKSDFERIIGAVKREYPSDDALLIQYHIYDVVTDGPLLDRLEKIRVLHSQDGLDPVLVHVSTVGIENEAKMYEMFTRFTSGGYEGLMIRNADGLYENKRSVNLQKVKEFDDAEFKIVGVKEGRGRLKGMLGTFTCQMKDGSIFDVKMSGNQDELTKYLTNKLLWRGKYLTVQYQGLTGKNGVPRFPVGLRIREAE